MPERKQLTKHELEQALFARLPLPQDFTDSEGVTYHGLLLSVQREDGSGSSFNVTLVTVQHRGMSGGRTVTFHLRTID